MSHLEANTHLKNSKDKAENLLKKKMYINRNYKVGVVLGRQAYSILKTGRSHLQYETDVSILSAAGTDVGNLNHSRKFVAEYAKSVHEVLVTQMQNLTNEPLPATGKPTPIAVLGDKMTPNRRTLQIVGFHGFINGKFQSLVSGVPPLAAETGIEVTKTLKSGLSSLNIPEAKISERIIGGAFDGEYVNLDVKNHLMNSMLISPEEREWYSFLWDPAHIIERAEKDAKKSDSLINRKSVEETFNTISRISKNFYMVNPTDFF